MSESLEEIILNNDYQKLLTCPKINEDITISSEKYVKKVQSNTHLPLMNLKPIHVAAMADSLECYRVIEYLTDQNFATLNASNYTPLDYACLYSSYEIITYIFGQIQRDPKYESLWKKIIISDTSKTDGRNLIYYAALAGSPEIMTILLQNKWGGDKVDNYITKAILTSIARNSPECLKILLKFKRTSLQSSNDLTPLMAAIASQTEAAVPVLLKTKCNLHYVTNSGHTALSIACMVGMVSAVRMICDRMQSIDIPNHYYGKYESAVHWMCSSGNPEIVKIMLDKYPDLNYTFNGKTGIMYIPKTQTPEKTIQILDMLVKYGYVLRNTADEINYFLSAITPKIEIIEWFINHGIDLNLPPYKTNNNQQTTLRAYIIEKSKKSNQFKQLVQKYPDLFQQDSLFSNFTPMTPAPTTNIPLYKVNNPKFK